jgi:hypothetical protein
MGKDKDTQTWGAGDLGASAEMPAAKPPEIDKTQEFTPHQPPLRRPRTWVLFVSGALVLLWSFAPWAWTGWVVGDGILGISLRWVLAHALAMFGCGILEGRYCWPLTSGFTEKKEALSDLRLPRSWARWLLILFFVMWEANHYYEGKVFAGIGVAFSWAIGYAVFPFAAGVLVGHYCWPNTVRLMGGRNAQKGSSCGRGNG